mgnify:CR=1 FL=1
MMVLSETVVILVIHKAWDTEVKLPLIQQLGDYAQTVFLCYLKLIPSTFIQEQEQEHWWDLFLYRHACK